MQPKQPELRGKCKDMAEALCAADSSLILVRGFYLCPFWGRQAHWWCERPDGVIIDPTAEQFPSNGIGEYIPFDGMVECAECGKTMREEDVRFSEGRYAWCSHLCHGRFIGVL